VSFTLDAIPAGPIVSGNGQLQFSNISFSSPFGAVDPSDVTFEVLADGVKLSGPVTVNGTGAKNFAVFYEVAGLSGPIEQASLLLESTVDAEVTALVLATKQVLGDFGDHPSTDDPGWPFDDPVDLDPLDLQTLAFLRTADWEIFGDPDFVGPNGLGNDGAVKLVERGFAGANSIQVGDAISLQVLEGTATWLSSTNRYVVVPEPATAALTAVGLMLLALRPKRKV
jgi:hypothetical protein